MTEEQRKAEPEAPRYASFRDRMFASCIDLILMLTLFSTFFSGVSIHRMEQAPPEEVVQRQVQDLMQRQAAGVVGFKQFIVEAYQTLDQVVDMQKYFVLVFLQMVMLALVVLPFWIKKGATPGKMILKMKIVDKDSFEEPSRRQLIGRFFGYFLSGLSLGLGYFWAAFHKRKQAWHDILSGTVVIRTVAPDSDWEKKRFKRQTILALLLILGYLIYHRVMNQ